MSSNDGWFDNQVTQFTRNRPLYERQADTLRSVLAHVAGLLCPDAIVQVRVKSLPSFTGKALRKHQEDPVKYADPVKAFADLCGGRLICHLRTEVDAVCELLEALFTIEERVDACSRLGRREFGYRSRHFVVRFNPDKLSERQVPVSVPEDLRPLKAEIQVRTFLEHAWSDVDHDRLYRARIRVPERLERESARLAAAMESADEAFSRFARALDEYQADYGGHTDRDAVLREVEILEVVRKYAADDERMAHQLARLLICLENWDAVIRLGDEFPDAHDAGLLYCVGHALCRRYEKDRDHPAYDRGQELLEKAARLDRRRVEPFVRLAETRMREGSLPEVFDYYSRAYDTDPAHPEALCGYVRYKIATERTLSFLPLVRPTILRALEKCRAQAAAGVNLPWALYHLGELNLLLGPDHVLASLNAYLAAASTSTAPHMPEQALQGLKLLGPPVAEQLPALAAARRLLVLALAVRPDYEVPALIRRQLADLKTPAARPVTKPVVIVAGGCDPAFQRQLEDYRPSLRGAFRRFRGTVISGGTTQGVAGFVGELGAMHPERITTVAYLPEVAPSDVTATPDERYHVVVRTGGRRFSPLEPLQCWIDLLAAGINPKRVRILGINGGEIAAFEYRLGLLLGAKVGLVRGSGRKADALSAEAELEPIPGLVVLPDDPMTLEAFLTVDAASGLSEEQRLFMAQRIHEDYRARNPPAAPKVDAAAKPWGELTQVHRDANLQQADDYQRKLAAIGKRAVAVPGGEIRCPEFSPDEVELLAQMEHGRYVAQKLLDGWTLGPRDDVKKQRPSLVPWNALPEEEKRKDREAVQNLPRFLKELGFEIRPLDSEETR